MTDDEVKLLTRLAADLVDKTLKPGEEGDKVFSFLAAAINRILLVARNKGIESKYEVVELTTRMWLVWLSYEQTHNPELLKDLQSIAVQLMKLAGEEPPKLPE